MATKTIGGFYGTCNPCSIFVYDLGDGSNAYVVEGSQNINITSQDLDYGVNVERVVDRDTIQADMPIDSEEELKSEVDQALFN